MPTTLISSDSGVYPFDGPVDFARHNKGVRAHFFTRSDKVVDEKGQPILDACGNPSEHEIELVTISIAGDLNTEYTGLAHDGTEMSPHLRFADEYQRWKAGDESTSGTKLEAWDGSNLSARMIRDMADLHIKSVEDLAAVSDVHVTKIIHGRDLRAKAVAWIAAHPSRQEASEPAKLREQNEMLVKRIIALEAARTVPTPPAAKLLSQNPAEAPKPHRSKAQLEQMARMRAAKAAKSATRAVTINTAELP